MAERLVVIGGDAGGMAAATEEANREDALTLARLMRTLDELPKPTIARVHDFIAASGRALAGKHHEIYLSDFRKVVYVDRLKPVSEIDSTPSLGGNNRQVRVRNADLTAERMFWGVNTVQPSRVCERTRRMPT